MERVRLRWCRARVSNRVGHIVKPNSELLMSHSDQYPALQAFISWSVVFGLLVTEWKAISILRPVRSAQWITAFVLPHKPKDISSITKFLILYLLPVKACDVDMREVFNTNEVMNNSQAFTNSEIKHFIIHSSALESISQLPLSFVIKVL